MSCLTKYKRTLRMKRKQGNTCVGKGHQGLDKKWKKIGREVVFLCQKVSWDDHRRKEGLETLRSLEVDGETLEERTLAQERKKRAVKRLEQECATW